MYAEQLLSEEEESRVTELIARYPEVQSRVVEIRRTIDSASDPMWLVGLACARAAAKRLTEAVGVGVTEVSCFIAKAERGLTSLFPSPELLIAQPVMLGDERKPGENAPSLGKRIDLPDKGGLRVSVIHAPGGSVTLRVRAMTPPNQGEVRVTAAVEEKAQAEKVTAWMREGRADIEDCPMGLLMVEAPGNRTLRILLQDIEEAVSGQARSGNG